MILTLTSETFSEESDGRFLSEGETRTVLPCRFLSKKSGSYSISYDEKSAESHASTRMAYDIESRTLTLSRLGDVRYTAVFGAEPCQFVYSVPPFSFDATAETESLTSSVTASGGTLVLSYLLTLNDVRRRVCLTAVLDEKEAKA